MCWCVMVMMNIQKWHPRGKHAVIENETLHKWNWKSLFLLCLRTTREMAWRCTRLVTWFALTLNVAPTASNPDHQLDLVITRFFNSIVRCAPTVFLGLEKLRYCDVQFCLHAIGCYDWPSCQLTRCWTIKKNISRLCEHLREKIPRKRMSHGSRRFLLQFFFLKPRKVQSAPPSGICTMPPAIQHLWSLGRFTMEFTCCETICIIDQACTSIVVSMPSVNENWLFKCGARNIAEDFTLRNFLRRFHPHLALSLSLCRVQWCSRDYHQTYSKYLSLPKSLNQFAFLCNRQVPHDNFSHIHLL